MRVPEMRRPLNPALFIGEKLRWQLQLLVDSEMSRSAKVVGALLMHDLNDAKGVAWRAQDSMATALTISADTVRRAVAEMSAAGYLQIEASRGPGRSQRYHALLDDSPGAIRSIQDAIRLRLGGETGDERVAPAPWVSDERVAPVLGIAEERVAPVLGIDGEPMAPVLGIPTERVAPVRQMGSTGATQYLKDSINSPLTPRATFANAEVRFVVGKRLGEEAVRSWLDPQEWDPDAREVVCRLNFSATWLAREVGKDLKTIGVGVECDPPRFAALVRAGRPVARGSAEA